MRLRSLYEDESLESVWDDMVFTEARLKVEQEARDFVAPVASLIARLDDARKGQATVRRDEVAAHAAVAAADDALDDCVRAIDRALSDAEHGNRQSARYKRYFTSTPSTFTRLGLESELSRVRGWVASLAGEPEQSLKDLGTRLDTIIKQGDTVLEQRRQAVAARSDHGVRTVTPLIEDINAARGSLYGNLAERGRKARLPPDWPSRFFRRSSRAPRVEEVTTPPPTGAAPSA